MNVVRKKPAKYPGARGRVVSRRQFPKGPYSGMAGILLTLRLSVSSKWGPSLLATELPHDAAHNLVRNVQATLDSGV